MARPKKEVEEKEDIIENEYNHDFQDEDVNNIGEEKIQPKQDNDSIKELELTDLPGVGAAAAEKLKENGYNTVMSIAVASPLTIAAATGIGDKVCRKIIQAARDAFGLGFYSAKESLEKRKSVIKLKINCESFDNLMDGGIETSAVTELFGGFGCHSIDTKVLTKNGVVNYKDLKIGDFVLGRDKYGNIIDSKITELHEYDFKGELIEFKTKKINLFVTPNHRLYFKRTTKSKEKIITAEDAYNMTGGIFPHIFKHKINKSSVVNLKKHVPIKKYKEPKKGGRMDLLGEINSSSLCELIGWYLSEGYIFKTKKSNAEYVAISIGNNIKRDKIIDTLERAGVKYSAYDKSAVIFHQDLAKYMRQFGEYAPNKYINKIVYNFSQSDLKLLFKSMMDGDGSKTGYTYTTCSKILAENLIVLLLHIGFYGSMRSRSPRITVLKDGRIIKGNHYEYSVNISYNAGCSFENRKDRPSVKNIKKIPYNNKVWCFTTETDNFFTERNGNFTFSGNSSKTNLAHLLAVTTLKQIPDGYVVYIDIEGTFRPERIKQFAKGQDVDEDYALEHIKVAHAYNSDHQSLLCEKVEDLITKEGLNVKLLIVDGVMSHFRSEFCFPKGVSITTISGCKNIEEITKGEMVLTEDGTYQEVIETINNESDSFVEINIIGNNKIKCTTNHPILVFRNNEYIYVNAENLIKEDYLCYPLEKEKLKELRVPNVIDLSLFNDGCIVDNDYIDINKNRYSMEKYNLVKKLKQDNLSCTEISEKTGVNISSVYAWCKTNQKPIYETTKVKRYIELNNDIMEVFGFYIAEGSLNDHQIVFTFNQHSTYEANKTKEVFKKYFDVDAGKDLIMKGARRVIFSRKLLVNFFKSFGTKAWEKEIPDFIYNQPWEKLLSLAKGEQMCDGYTRKYDKSFITTSPRLFCQLRNIYAHSDIPTGGKYDENNRERKLYRSRIIDGNNENFFIKNGKIHFKYISQTKYNQKQKTYNLTIKNNNNYVADGVIVHNCGRGTLADRQQKLNKHLHVLSKLAHVHNMAVLITNQVMSDPAQFFGDPTKAVGGNIMAHLSDFRVYLRKGAKDSRVAKLVNAPNLPDGECSFMIEDGGFKSL